MKSSIGLVSVVILTQDFDYCGDVRLGNETVTFAGNVSESTTLRNCLQKFRVCRYQFRLSYAAFFLLPAQIYGRQHPPVIFLTKATIRLWSSITLAQPGQRVFHNRCASTLTSIISHHKLTPPTPVSPTPVLALFLSPQRHLFTSSPPALATVYPL